jgi:integrase
MSGRRLQIGEHGDIAYREAEGKVTATFYYRNNQGRRRRIEATAATRTAARRDALAALDRALSSGGIGQYSSRSTFADVAEQWYAQLVSLAESGRRSPTTIRVYRGVLDRHVLPGIGSLRLSELSASRVDHFIHQTRRKQGYSVAKMCRSIMSGVCGLAVRRDALRTNPVRDVAALESGVTKEARALTPAECGEWLTILDADAYAARKDLPDLVRFLLGTGVRLGEALGVQWSDVDLAHQVVHIRRTVVRVKGRGILAKAPKTRAGVRSLRLPLWLAGLLRERLASADVDGPVFPDALGGYRDLSNVERDFRQVRAGTPFEWVVPHTYRKTVATLLDGDGLSARTIADQLGHARISMTQDVYMGRRVVDQAAASALEDLLSGPDDEDPPASVAAIR